MHGGKSTRPKQLDAARWPMGMRNRREIRPGKNKGDVDPPLTPASQIRTILSRGSPPHPPGAVQQNEDYVLKVLQEVGLVSRKQIDAARKGLNGQDRILDVLIKDGVVSESDVSRSIAAQAHMDWIDLSTMVIPPDIIKQIRAEDARMARGQPGKQFTGPQRTDGPNENLGSARRIFEHNHTNEVFVDKGNNEVRNPKDGTLIHQGDRVRADQAAAPYMVTDKSGNVRDLYMPSKDEGERTAHTDWAIDRQESKAGVWGPWRTIMTEPPTKTQQVTPAPPTNTK
jgi:hypothetical protein